MKKYTFPVAISVCLLLAAGAVITGSLLMNQGDSLEAFNTSTNICKISPVVLDGMTDEPIVGAKIVILEGNEVYETDVNGSTGEIEVPLITDARFNTILPKPWGEVTVIVYADGYLPYALFYLEVMAGQTRQGPEILMFTQKDAPSADPFSIIEGPNRQWVNALIKKYEP
jgi:hypothetical protein